MKLAAVSSVYRSPAPALRGIEVFPESKLNFTHLFLIFHLSYLVPMLGNNCLVVVAAAVAAIESVVFQKQNSTNRHIPYCKPTFSIALLFDLDTP